MRTLSSASPQNSKGVPDAPASPGPVLCHPALSGTEGGRSAPTCPAHTKGRRTQAARLEVQRPSQRPAGDWKPLVFVCVSLQVLAGDNSCHARSEEGSLFRRSFLGAEQTAFYTNQVSAHTLIILLDPMDPDAYLQRGAARVQLGLYQSAVDDYDHALKIKPDDAAACRSRAYAKWLAGSQRRDRSDAGEGYAKARWLGEKKPEPAQQLATHFYFFRSEGKERDRDVAGALADLNKAIVISAENPYAFMHRAAIRLRLGDLMGSIADYSIAAQIDPVLSRVFAGRAAARRALGDLSGALADYDHSVTLNPDDPDVRYERGELREKGGDAKGAIEDFTVPIEMQWREARAYIRRAHVRGLEEDYEGAVADANAAVEADPEAENAYIARGNAKGDAGDFDGALADYEAGLEIDPESAGVYYNRGLARCRARFCTDALKDFSEAIALKPSRANAYLARSETYAKMEDLEAAKEDVERAISMEPREPRGYLHRAHLKLLQGDQPSAIGDYEKASELAPSLLTGRLYLYMLLAVSGAQEQALETLADISRILRDPVSESWEVQLARHLTGMLPWEDLLCQAHAAPPPRQDYKVCSAHCLVGAMALMQGENPAATDSFQKAVETKGCVEAPYQIAAAALHKGRGHQPSK